MSTVNWNNNATNFSVTIEFHALYFANIFPFSYESMLFLCDKCNAQKLGT